MNHKDTVFQELESGIQSHNQSSGHLLELESHSQRRLAGDSQNNLQLDNIKQKRDIFDRSHYTTLTGAHKVDVTEDDCHISNASLPRSDIQGSISSISQKIIGINNQKPVGFLKFEQPQDEIISGAGNLSPLRSSILRTRDKLVKYQTLVQKLEDEEHLIEMEKQKQAELTSQVEVQIVRDGTKQLSLKPSKSKIQGLNDIWGQNAFNIIRLVSRFIQQLKTKTEKIKFRMMNQRIYEVIGDSSADFEYILFSQWIKQKPKFVIFSINQMEICEHWLRIKAQFLLDYLQVIGQWTQVHLKVIKPDSPFKISWDIILLLFVILNIFYIPIQISFQPETSVAMTWIFGNLPSYILIMEVVLNFNTAYYDKGLMREERDQIAKHYIKGNLVWDLLVVIPFLLSQLNIPYLQYCLLFRITRLPSLMQNIEDILNFKESIQIMIDLFKLVFFIILTGHFTGCAWHFVAIVEKEQFGAPYTWLDDQRAYDNDWFDRFILSFYWSIITTLTVGYGDVKPVTTTERIYVAIVALVVCGIFGYCLSQIGTIFKTISENSNRHKVQLRVIDSHIKKRMLSLPLQLKVRKYFEYYFRLETEENQHAEKYMEQLTKHLKEEVLTDLYSKNIKQSRFLKENFLEDTLNALCLVAKEKKLLPEQMLFQKNDPAKNFYFVLQGQLEFIAEHDNHIEEILPNTDNQIFNTETYLKKIQSGTCIGEREFITQHVYNYSARATKYSQLLYIEYDDFIKVLKENRAEFERFCLIRDNLLYNVNYKSFGQVCEICQWTHGFIQCPFVFLQPNKNKIASKFSSTKVNKRLTFPYRSLPKTNCRLALNEIQEAVLGLIVVHNIMTEKDITDNVLIDFGFQLNASTPDDPLRPLSLVQPVQSQFNPLKGEDERPHAQTSIQTVPLESKLFNSKVDHQSGLDWDNQSQFRRSFQKIKIDGLNKQKTLQSLKNKYNSQLQPDLDESVIQEEVKIQNHHQNSVNLVQTKLKIQRQKAVYRKVSWLDFGDAINNQNPSPSPSPPQDSSQDTRLRQKSNQYKTTFSKQLSKQSESNDVENDVKVRMEHKENSIVSRKQKGSNSFSRRRQKKQNSLINQSMMSSFSQQADLKSNQKSNSTLLTNRNNSNNLQFHDQINDPNLQNNSLIVNNSDIDIGFQRRVQDITHQHLDFEIDCYYSSKIYFPNFNLETVIVKLSQHYDELNQVQIDEDLKAMKRTKTNLTLFDRIKKNATTFRGSFLFSPSRLDND